MDTLFLIVLGLFVAGVAIRRPWLRRDMVTGAVFSLPFLLIQPLVGDRLWDGIVADSWQAWGLRTAWVVLIGAIAAALYTRYIHRHLRLVVHARRGLMTWLILGPLLTISLVSFTNLGFLVGAGIGLLFQLVLVIIFWRKLISDAITAMSGLALLYLVFYLILGQVLSVSGPETGIFVFKYPLEDILRVLAFGALWGPPFAAVRALTRGDTPFVAHRQIPRQATAAAGLALLIFGTAWLYLQFVRIPQVVAATGETEVIESLAGSVVIQFNQPVDRETLKIVITPEVKGSISYGDPYLQRSLVRRAVFTPDQHFAPDTKYEVSVESVKSVLGNGLGVYRYDFQTPALPTVASTIPSADQKDVTICEPVTIALTAPVSELSEFSFAFAPEVAYTAEVASDKKSYVLKPKECLAQNQSYSLSVSRRLMVYDSNGELLSSEEPTVVSTTNFSTKGAPGLLSVSPSGSGVYTSTKDITVQFSEAMEAADLSTLFSISPALAGSWNWKDSQTAVFAIGTTLPYETKYTLSLATQLKDLRGGFLPAGELASFTTIGHVKVSSVSPYKGGIGVKTNATISITFDQPVDKASAEERFSISPKAEGSFSWSDKTLMYKASMSKDTNYEVKMASGVKSLVGLDLESTFSSTFRTEESVTQLNIPLYYQRYSLSCEIAALKMALNYKSVNISEDEIFAKMPHFTGSRGSDNVWGDPDKEFVGNINGKQNSSGYGVYAAPIAKVALNWRSAKQLGSSSLSALAGAIADGNPVVIWGTMSPARKDSWTTSEGKVVSAYVGEHARTLIGFVGSVENPTSFIINDPIYGRLKWSASQMQSNWNAMWNMAVVVY